MTTFLYIHRPIKSMRSDKGQILQFLDAIFHLFQFTLSYYTVLIKWEGFQPHSRITIYRNRKEENYA